MLLVRRFRVLILLVFLLACTLHIMIDLLPKLERRAEAAGAGAEAAAAAGGPGGASAGCSCSHSKAPAAAEGQDWAKAARGGSEAAAAAATPGWPSKHTLRILQDFSSEPNANLSAPSGEKGAKEPPGARKTLMPDAGGGGGGGGGGREAGLGGHRPSGAGLQRPQAGQGSKLATLFQQPLYRLAGPPLGDHDVLFNVNSDIRFNPKAAENQEQCEVSSYH
uniref:Uncharacterized protein n=1 Tax=Sphaerodactylus townsendi TaxID=933632 RepID=A0ACB8FMD8_9SAUR